MALYLRATYVTKLGAAQANARYIAFRSREMGEKKGVFNAEKDHVDVREFNGNLNDPLTKHYKVAKAHKLIISMSRDEWQKAGSRSYQEMVRETMANYEMRTGKKLEWIAAVHDKSNNPHAHVLIKATYTDSQGQKHRLRLNKADITAIKKEFTGIVDKEKEFARDIEKELEHEYEDRVITKLEGKDEAHAVGDIWEALVREVQRQVKEAEREKTRGKGL